MKQYLDLLQKILHEGREKESGRVNMPNTLGISHGVIQMDLNDGFPLLTTKKMPWKLIVHELLWFLRGETNIKYLVDNNVNIWNGDAYRWYLKIMKDINYDPHFKTQEDFIEAIKTQPDGYLGEPGHYNLGDLGKVYGKQWRDQNGVDQVKDVIDGLKSNPYSRYHIIDAWNKADFKDMALPPCHLLYHFIVKPFNNNDVVHYLNKYYLMYDQKPWNDNLIIDNGGYEKICEQYGVPKFYLDLSMYQRSCDTFLGVPFNLASMSTLLMLIATVSGMEPGVATWIGGDVHLYLDHIPVVEEQLTRIPYRLPELKFNKNIKTLDDILALTVEDFQLVNYHCHDVLKGELFTGVNWNNTAEIK